MPPKVQNTDLFMQLQNWLQKKSKTTVQKEKLQFCIYTSVSDGSDDEQKVDGGWLCEKSQD